MEHVQLCEVGPRDGFQFESIPIPVGFKKSVISRLVDAGIPRIQATSFVHPRRVPQMADAEELLASLSGQTGNTVLTALALNLRGVERAISSQVKVVDLSIALNETHARDNANSTVEEGVVVADAMITTAQEAGLEVQLGFQTVWGYDKPDDTPVDRVLALVEQFRDRGLESLSLADSTGMASPITIRRMIRAVRGVDSETPLVLHLHDTRGLGLANVSAALDEGVRRFDTSLGGLGGCPFIPGATGNVATEDVIYLAERLGFGTGIDLGHVAAVSREVSEHLGRPLTGRMYRLV